jgi:DNA-binding NarL/FixJ family response regulator
MSITLLLACAAGPARDLLIEDLHRHAPDVSCVTVDAGNAFAVASCMRPDVALVDADAGLQTLQAIHRASPGTASLFLCEECSRSDVIDAVRLGAAGCVLRSGDAALLSKAIRIVHGGGRWFARNDLLEALMSQLRVPAPNVDIGTLTHREEEIVELIGLGLSNKEIGRRLAISDHTVKTHLHRVYSKLHQSGRIKAWLAQPGMAAAAIPLEKKSAAGRP